MVWTHSDGTLITNPIRSPECPTVRSGGNQLHRGANCPLWPHFHVCETQAVLQRWLFSPDTKRRWNVYSMRLSVVLHTPQEKHATSPEETGVCFHNVRLLLRKWAPVVALLSLPFCSNWDCLKPDKHPNCVALDCFVVFSLLGFKPFYWRYNIVVILEMGWADCRHRACSLTCTGLQKSSWTFYY